jgi:hypothetical protein
MEERVNRESPAYLARFHQLNSQIYKQAIEKISETIVALTTERIELSYRISQLENVKATLTRLLPTDKRIDRLFS